MIGPITGSVAENEGFSTWSHTPEDTTAIGRHWRRWLSPVSSTASPSRSSPDGVVRVAFDDQAMIAHVTSPFTDKIVPYRSNPPTDPRTLSPSFSFFLLSFFLSSCASFPLHRHLSPGSRLVSAREHVAIAQPPGNSITVDHLDHELTPCRARTVVLWALRYLSIYVHIHGQEPPHLFQVKRTIAHSPLIGIPKITMPCRDHLLRSPPRISS